MGFLPKLFACIQKRLKSVRRDEDENGFHTEGLFFQLGALQLATNFFSEPNRLGHGGFGPVYKGSMPNGQEVAVKKLSLDSRQGVKQFINEVKLLLKTQHKNLVMLLGCCAEGPEKMLVYEYLPNKSLDHFLFGKNMNAPLYVAYTSVTGQLRFTIASKLSDEKKASSLDWQTRFKIVRGIARGLLYLHEEAPERIIHLDIKVGNILLDQHLNPKISDFGLARLFPEDVTHVNTFRISGTRGYMAPEYAMHGYLSVKTDVFSYGVVVLEIVSGRKNLDSSLASDKADLLNYAWMLFRGGKSMDLVDPSLEKYDRDEAAMCIQLGLLCCQQSVGDRPDMKSVHLMLSSDSFTLPKPARPAIRGHFGRWTTTSTAAFTNTNVSSKSTGATRGGGPGGIFLEDCSRNYVSCSSFDEGR